MDAKNILRGFGSWGLSHIRREGNMMAHILAKFVVSSEQMKVRFVSYPTCLSGLVSSELFSPAF
jgi:hypothetical protein